MRNRRLLLIDLVLLSFAFHFVWEFLQIPLYLGMPDLSHREGVVLCARATAGDVAIALLAFALPAAMLRDWAWPVTGGGRAAALFLGTGLGLTVLIEHLSTAVFGRWTYAAAMPRLPLLGTGLAPVAQWVAVPLLVLWYLRRLHRPARS